MTRNYDQEFVVDTLRIYLRNDRNIKTKLNETFEKAYKENNSIEQVALACNEAVESTIRVYRKYLREFTKLEIETAEKALVRELLHEDYKDYVEYNNKLKEQESK